MSSYLLDTHALLWWLDDPAKLSSEAREAIANGDSLVYVSAAVAWEMAIKKSIGRLDIPTNLPEVLRADNIEVLDINIHHALTVGDLPMLHQDPFDRMQIAQANVENLTLITRDKQIKKYDVKWINA
ncbi:type II toxin-antitoxin system VapC family toxin [bacterium AH-315-J04]|nr:type II toxin-antitoxin system VapC family toxin [bacterium AH-315-J04]